MNIYPKGISIMLFIILAACSPKIQIDTSDKPIRLDLNVKIEHELRIKLDKDTDDLIKKNPNLFDID